MEAPVRPAPAAELTPIEKYLREENFTVAAMRAGLQFDDTVNQVSVGALMLANWLDRHGVVSRPLIGNQTKIALVKKDSASERAKRMCVTGTIIQIAKEPGTRTVFSGTLIAPGVEPVHFIAAGSTGELVDDSKARFCGFVTGRYFFSNVSGGQTQSVQMVGAFDLPENKLAAIP